MATAGSDSAATEHTEVPQLAELVNQEAGLVMPRPPNSNARPGSSQDHVVNVRTVFEPPLRQIYDHRISYGSSNSIATELATEPCLIVRGKHIWSEFYWAAGLSNANTVALLDKHWVVDTLCERNAIRTGIKLEFLPGIRTVLLSYGRDHRKATFKRDEPWYPLINNMHGYIFTDYRECWRNTVEVYRENWMGMNCIAIRGDKGQAAELLNKPSLLFDDKEDNIDLLRARSTPLNKLDGVVVRMGKKRRYNVARGYVANYHDDHWEGLIADFDYYYGRGCGQNVHGDSSHRPPYVPPHGGHNRW